MVPDLPQSGQVKCFATKSRETIACGGVREESPTNQLGLKREVLATGVIEPNVRITERGVEIATGEFGGRSLGRAVA